MTLNKINEVIDKYFDEEVKFLQRTLSFNTVLDEKSCTDIHPFGERLTVALDDFLNDAKSRGFSIKNIDNMVGYAEVGDKNGRLIGVLGHLDTVPYNNLEDWIAEPTSGKIIDDNIYGRGTTDDKGPTVACYFALIALMRAGVKLKNRFRLILGLDEESGFSCVKRYLKSEDIPAFSFSPDAKFPAVYGEKGIYQFSIKRQFQAIGKEPIILLGMTAGDRHNIVPDKAVCYFGGKDISKLFVEIEDKWKDKGWIEAEYFENMLKITVTGEAVHAMHPEKGINAIQRLFSFLANIDIDYSPSELKLWIKDMHSLFKMESDGKSLGLAMSDDISGKLTINFAAIRYNSKDMFGKFDIRYPITINPEYLDNEVIEAVKRMMVTMRVDDHKIPLHIDKNSPDVKKLLTAYREVTGDMSEPITIGGGTYARAFPNALSYGGDMPDDKQLAHQTNEHISLKKLRTITKIYANALYKLNEI